MDNRLKTLFDLAGEGDVFLDIGCDHGKVSYAALSQKKFKKVIITDISAKSLDKAVKLMQPFKNDVKAIVTDGFCGIDDDVSVAFIAGMGGEEICKILSQAKKLPNKLVLSPQKNTEKVRRLLIKSGYKIVKDFTFFESKKYYDAISAEKGEDFYTDDEYRFGRDNLKFLPVDFVNKIKSEIKLKQSVIDNVNASGSEILRFKDEITKLKEIINEN